MFGLAQSPPWQVRAKCSILWTPPLKPKTMEPSFSAAVFIYVGNYGSIFSLGFDKISVAFKKEKKKGKLPKPKRQEWLPHHHPPTPLPTKIHNHRIFELRERWERVAQKQELVMAAMALRRQLSSLRPLSVSSSRYHMVWLFSFSSFCMYTYAYVCVFWCNCVFSMLPSSSRWMFVFIDLHF